MARRQQTRGECVYCGRTMTRSGMAKHLQTCPQRGALQVTANQAKGREQTLYHLQVQDAWHGEYWLQLEMRGNASLEDLDTYLRAIWLECCGHLSAFTVGPYRYTQIIAGSWMSDDEKAMDVQTHKLFAPGMAIPYRYDFGTTSHLVINVINQRIGKPTTAHPIVLMARTKRPSASVRNVTNRLLIFVCNVYTRAKIVAVNFVINTAWNMNVRIMGDRCRW